MISLLEGLKSNLLEGGMSKSFDLPKFAENIKSEIISTLKEADRKLCETKIYKEANLEKEYVNGRECRIRTDIDYNKKDDFGKTNLERMKEGKAPINKHGQKIELHHKGQKMDSILMELTMYEHRGQGNDSILHNKQKESEIDRNKFNIEKSNHWKARASRIEEIISKGGNI